MQAPTVASALGAVAPSGPSKVATQPSKAVCKHKAAGRAQRSAGGRGWAKHSSGPKADARGSRGGRKEPRRTHLCVNTRLPQLGSGLRWLATCTQKMCASTRPEARRCFELHTCARAQERGSPAWRGMEDLAPGRLNTCAARRRPRVLAHTQ